MNTENAEIWKPIEGFENYQVSTSGRVKSLNYRRTKQEQILKPRDNGHGYLHVHLRKDGKNYWRYIHRLVAEAFLPNPNNLPEINHKDENPYNNQIENICWTNHNGNINWGTHNERVAKANSKSVLQYSLDGTFIKEWASTREVERQLGFNQGNIGKCCRGEYKTAYGFTWKYKED